MEEPQLDIDSPRRQFLYWLYGPFGFGPRHHARLYIEEQIRQDEQMYYSSQRSYAAVSPPQDHRKLWSDWLERLRLHGYIEGNLDLAETSQIWMLQRHGVKLTGKGREWVKARFAEDEVREQAQDQAERHARRGDPILRAATARRGILKWLHEQYHKGVEMPDVRAILASPHGLHEEEPLAEEDLRRALTNLAGRGFIAVRPAPNAFHATITHAGEHCVERYDGDATKYIEDNPLGGNVHNDYRGIHIEGGVHGGQGGNLVITTGDVQVDSAAMTSFADAMLRGLTALRLPPQQEDEFRGILREMQQEVSGSDPVRGARAFDRMVQYLAAAGKPVLAAVFTLVAQHYGLPSSH